MRNALSANNATQIEIYQKRKRSYDDWKWEISHWCSRLSWTYIHLELSWLQVLWASDAIKCNTRTSFRILLHGSNVLRWVAEYLIRPLNRLTNNRPPMKNTFWEVSCRWVTNLRRGQRTTTTTVRASARVRRFFKLAPLTLGLLRLILLPDFLQARAALLEESHLSKHITVEFCEDYKREVSTAFTLVRISFIEIILRVLSRPEEKVSTSKLPSIPCCKGNMMP